MIKFDKNEFLKPQIYSTLDEYETRCNVTKEIIEEIEQLQKENQKLKEQQQQKGNIINKVREYCDFGIKEWTTDDGFVEKVLKDVKEILDNKGSDK